MPTSAESISFTDEEQIQPVGRLLAALRIAAGELSRHAIYRAELTEQITPAATAVFLTDVATVANSLAMLADTVGVADIRPAARALRDSCQQALGIRPAGVNRPADQISTPTPNGSPSDHHERR